MRNANQPNKGQVGFGFLKEAKHNGDRALARRRTLTAAQNKSILRGGLKSINFPLMMWLGYVIGSQRAS